MNENEKDFRLEILQKGLIVEPDTKENRPKNAFFLDLNQGQFVIEADPKKVMRVVRIARKHADFDGYGEHNAILDLIAHIEQIKDGGQIYWHRPYHVKDRSGMISMRNWLWWNGQFPGTVFLDKSPFNRFINRVLTQKQLI